MSLQTLCHHQCRRRSCPICVPYLHCTHTTVRSQCHICRPELLCMHRRWKSGCTVCKPQLLCKHGTRKYKCWECVREKHSNHVEPIPVLPRMIPLLPSIDMPALECIHGMHITVCADCKKSTTTQSTL